MVRALLVLAVLVAAGCGPERDKPAVTATAQAPGAIVFDGYVEKDGTADRGYFAIAPDGEALRKLAFPEGDSDLSFSSNGSASLTVFRGPEEVPHVVVSRSDIWKPQEVPLPAQALAGTPSLSPDGKTVALGYLPPESAESNVWTLAVDGRGLRQVSATGGVTNTAWSPDGAWIAFADERAAKEIDAVVIYVVRPDGSDLHRIAGEYMDGRPAWSPDGTRLALEDLTGRLVVVDADGSNMRVLNSSGEGPAWSPDGKWIAFARNVPYDGGGVRGFALLIVPAGGGAAHEIGPKLGDEWGPLSWTTAPLAAPSRQG